MRHVVSCGKNFADIVRQNSPDLGETTEELVLKQVKSAEKAACKPGCPIALANPVCSVALQAACIPPQRVIAAACGP